jgi:murein tripeptide amidase MpaA
MRRPVVLIASGGLVLGLLGAAPALAAPAPESAAAGPTVYTGELTPQQLGRLREVGADHEDIATAQGTGGALKVEVVLTGSEAAKARALGIPLAEKRVGGTAVSRTMAAEAASGYTVFRSYSEPGGIREEYESLARQNPAITKLVTIGTTVQGKPIIAVKVTKGARQVRDGSRPAVLYSSTQHAREWITPEMNRRLFRYYLANYASNAEIRRIVDTTELWFVPVANPDGYDFTFTEGNRLWRKNLRDNDGDGQITGADGVDPNRNYPTKWGYDNEGSSSSFGSQTYRGTAPSSEPETRALDGLLRRIRPKFQVNYHSAAELLLYGVGWQVATPTPDDLLAETLAGDDANPAVPGYDPDISAELYTTNGETTEHAHNTYGTIAFTPEMSTCETASAVDPNDAFEPGDCESVFNFPDSEALIQGEFEKNIPFALSVAKSARNPADPVSAVGRTAPDFQTDPFTVSYGDPQPVAVTARRDIRGLTLNYQINNGRPQRTGVREWRGGERYGGELDVYYAEFRGVVRGARPGDQVKVWFSGYRPGHGQKTSEAFTYTLAQNSHAKVLVLANEDYEGVNPGDTPSGATAPKYAQTYVNALRANGISSTVFDMSAQGVPHHLGVLSHFRGVVWYLGDNRLTQDPEDFLTRIGRNNFEDAAVAERQQYLTMAVRDYLNEGGKLVQTGETASYYGQLGSVVGGIYYGLDGAPEQDCVVTQDLFSDCLLLADDFSQYYLGAYGRSATSGPTAFTGAGRLSGTDGTFGGPATVDNPLDEPGQFTVTSDVLPPAQYPTFASSRAGGAYVGGSGGAFVPVEGSWYVSTLHADDSYMRLARTVDLTGVTAAQAPQLRAQLSFDTEPGYDSVIVEAHTVGADDWTTLPETGGLTSTDVPTECEVGFLLAEHPFLEHYLTPGDPCTATGTSGSWNAMTGSSDGWQQATFDLSAFAGKQVEISISYVTDPGTGGAGVFIDDTAIVVGGAVTEAEGFETGLGAWSLPGAPAGSPPGGGDFSRSQSRFSAAVTTTDTVLLGFGVEQLATPAEQVEILGRAVRAVLG